jgi:hypothetical protein
MAARKIHTTLRDEWRQKIRASMLINRLQDHAFGEVDMSPTQLKAAEILLKKVAPDLARTEMTGEDGGPQELVVRWGTPK